MNVPGVGVTLCGVPLFESQIPGPEREGQSAASVFIVAAIALASILQLNLRMRQQLNTSAVKLIQVV